MQPGWSLVTFVVFALVDDVSSINHGQNCSKAEIAIIVGTAAADRVDATMRLLESNPACASCLITASQAVYPELLYEVHACMHQNENECTDSTGLARVAPLLQNVSLQNRESVIAMLAVAEANCVYCILEAIEGACGTGCVESALHMQARMPRAPRCAPSFYGIPSRCLCVSALHIQARTPRTPHRSMAFRRGVYACHRQTTPSSVGARASPSWHVSSHRRKQRRCARPSRLGSLLASQLDLKPERLTSSSLLERKCTAPSCIEGCTAASG